MVATTFAQLPAVTIGFENDNRVLPSQFAPGSSVAFYVQSPPSSSSYYQWLFNDAVIPGARGPRLQRDNLSPFDTGNYRLAVRNSSGATEYSNTLVLNVVAPPASPIDASFTARLPVNVASADPIAVLADNRVLVSCVLAGESPDPAKGWSPAYYRLGADGNFDSSYVFPRTAGVVLATAADGATITTKPPYWLNARGIANPFALPASFDSSQPLTAAAFQADGKVLIAQGTQLVRYNLDRTVDPTFSYSSTRGTQINLLKVDWSSRILVHGQIALTTTLTWLPNPVSDVTVRILPTGANDATFIGPPPSSSDFPGYTVFLNFFPLTDGGYIGIKDFRGQSSIVHLKADGTADATASGGLALAYGTDIAVDPAGYVYTAAVDSILHRYLTTAGSFAVDPSFYQGQTTGDSPPSPGVTNVYTGALLFQPDGHLVVGGSFAAWDGHSTPRLARLRSGDTTAAAPSVSCGASNRYPRSGETVTLSCQFDRPAEGSITFQWLALDGQPMPADTISPTLVIAAFTARNLGRYQARITTAAGSVLATPIELVTSGAPAYLANLSGRALTGTGEDVVIAGLTLDSSVTCLLRGVGPALKTFGVSNTLPNPAINLYTSSGVLIGKNDNWSDSTHGGDIAAFASRTGAFALANDSLDAADIHDFARGGFSLQLADPSGDHGVGLVEIYSDPGDPSLYVGSSSLINLSFRAHTGPGDATAIAGFVIVSPQNSTRSARVLLRAIGPSLGPYGIQHPLTNPILTVYNSKGGVVTSNDDWAVNNSSGDAATLAATMKQVGAFALTADSKDSALILNLPAGAYSMQASGGSGVVLLEVYLIR